MDVWKEGRKERPAGMGREGKRREGRKDFLVTLLTLVTLHIDL